MGWQGGKGGLVARCTAKGGVVLRVSFLWIGAMACMDPALLPAIPQFGTVVPAVVERRLRRAADSI